VFEYRVFRTVTVPSSGILGSLKIVQIEDGWSIHPRRGNTGVGGGNEVKVSTSAG